MTHLHPSNSTASTCPPDEGDQSPLPCVKSSTSDDASDEFPVNSPKNSPQTLKSLLEERASIDSIASRCSTHDAVSSLGSSQHAPENKALKCVQLRLQHQYVQALLHTGDPEIVAFSRKLEETTDGEFMCEHCREVFYTEEDCYNHAYEDNSILSYHSWFEITSKRLRKGLHIIVWGGERNASLIMRGEHAITVGDGQVVYMSSHEKRVVQDALDTFAGSDKMYLQMYPSSSRDSHDDVEKRALCAIGKVGFNTITSNSEHFATWAIHCEKKSGEVQKAGAAASTGFYAAQVTGIAAAASTGLLAPGAIMAASTALSASSYAAWGFATMSTENAEAHLSDSCYKCHVLGKLVSRVNSRISVGNSDEEEEEEEDLLDTFFGGMLTFTDRLVDAFVSEEEEIEADEDTCLYRVCEGPHLACALCIQESGRLTLCPLNDCYERFDAPDWLFDTDQE